MRLSLHASWDFVPGSDINITKEMRLHLWGSQLLLLLYMEGGDHGEQVTWYFGPNTQCP